MAITYVAAGATRSGTGAGSVGLPAGIQDDDLLILHIEGEGQDANADEAPSGGDWTPIDTPGDGSVASGTDSSADRTRHTLYYHVYDSASPPALYVPDSGDHHLCTITAWRGVDPTTPIHATQSSSLGSNSTSHTATGTTTTTNNCMVVFSTSIGDNDDINSQANATLDSLTEAFYVETTSGSDGGMAVTYGLLSTAGSTGNMTFSTTSTEEDACWCIALEPYNPVVNASIELTGFEVTSAYGAMVALGDEVPNTNELSWAIGSASVSYYPLAGEDSAAGGDASIGLTGLSATVSQGTLTTTVDDIGVLTGQEATVSQGTLAPKISLSLSGQIATTAYGSITPAVSITPTGQESTVSQGTLTTTVDDTGALSGQESTVEAGTLTPKVGITLSGQGAAISQGTLGLEISKALTGQESTISQGMLTPVVAYKGVLAGKELAVSTGTITPKIGVYISGQIATTAYGSITPALTVGLTGQETTSEYGTFTTTVDDSGVLTGQEATATQGSLSPSIKVALTGQEATTGQGTLAKKLSVELSGYSLTSDYGTLTPDVRHLSLYFNTIRVDRVTFNGVECDEVYFNGTRLL